MRNKMRDIIAKDKAYELFRDAINDDNQLIKDSKQEWVKFKFKKYQLESQKRKISHLVRSKFIIGPRAIMAQIKQFSIIKEVFLLHFEQEPEIMIPS